MIKKSSQPLPNRTIKITASSVPIKPIDKDDRESHLIYYHAEDSGGYSDNNVRVDILENGGVCLLDADDMESGIVYLYPEQVKHLKRILKGVK